MASVVEQTQRSGVLLFFKGVLLGDAQDRIDCRQRCYEGYYFVYHHWELLRD